MIPFVRLTGVALSLPSADIDTDQIIPAQFLTGTERTGLGRHLFHNLRANPDGSPKADSPFDRAPFSDACILIAGGNFGCGSSREHAVWALLDFGIRCVIAPSFGDIFRANCGKNGILAVTLAPELLDGMALQADGSTFCVDLEACEILGPDRQPIGFLIDPLVRRKLLRGLDDIGETLLREPAIAAFEAARR